MLGMKSAYELAMERLTKTAPSAKLTAAQKSELADLESRCKARIAEREIFIQGEITKATEGGDYATIQDLERQLVSERKALLADLEEKKERVRQGR